MEAKVIERFEQAKELVNKKTEEFNKEVNTWWNDTFCNGLDGMLEELYYDDWYTIDFRDYSCHIRRCVISSRPYYITIGKNKNSGRCVGRQFGYSNINDIGGLKWVIEELNKQMEAFNQLRKDTKKIVDTITEDYENKITKQNEDLDEIFDMLGQETETTKRCKVTVEWI